uniref:Serum response factor n=1 Tax=Schmidtea mediterranea TaxID=79327 RepID=I1ZI63_SCHMD|nr:serum response factor [Schmidtea mediterranea]
MNKSINSNGSETGTEGSEPIDLTRIGFSSESMSDKDLNFETNSNREDLPAKKPRFKGKNKIDIEFITKKSRRQSTFSKRKTGLMKKAYELAELTGAEVLLMIASDTNHVYTYGTTKMKPVFESEQGKLLIEACLNNNLSVKNMDNNNAQCNQVELTNNDFFSSPAMDNNCQSSTTNHIGQLVFNVDNSVCRDTKIVFPLSIGNGLSSANQNLISSAAGFPANNIHGDNIILSNAKSEDALLLPVSLGSIPPSILSKNNNNN